MKIKNNTILWNTPLLLLLNDMMLKDNNMKNKIANLIRDADLNVVMIKVKSMALTCCKTKYYFLLILTCLWSNITYI